VIVSTEGPLALTSASTAFSVYAVFQPIGSVVWAMNYMYFSTSFWNGWFDFQGLVRVSLIILLKQYSDGDGRLSLFCRHKPFYN
jgi:cytochrome c oxidase subunit IV